MRAGDAGQDIMIGRMGLEYTVLYDMYIAVRTFCNASACPIENCFLTARFLCLLGFPLRYLKTLSGVPVVVQ